MVTATLNYLRPDGPPNRRYVAPGAEMNTGVYDPYRVEIADARPLAPTLASHGFTVLKHRSVIEDFEDVDAIDRLYTAETDELIRAATGAELTIPFGWMRRAAGSIDDARQPPAAEVHVDFTPDRADRNAPSFLQRVGETRSPTRFLITSLWRCFSPPPQDWPIALCAGYSVGEEEGTPNLMIRVPELPDAAAAFAPLDDEGQYQAASIFTHNPAHRWFYYPDMTRDEALLITFYDSARGPNWRVPHTAFADEGAAGAHRRESIELRSIAYWFD